MLAKCVHCTPLCDLHFSGFLCSVLSLPTFWDNLSFPSSRANTSGTLKKGPKCCPETSVRNYHYTLRNNKEEHRSRVPRGGSLKSRVYHFVFILVFDEA